MIPDGFELPAKVESADLIADRRGSRIWRAVLADGQVVAVKHTTAGSPLPNGHHLAAREATVLQQLGHTGFLRGSGLTPVDSWIAVTWCDAPTLLDHWRPLRSNDTTAARQAAHAASLKAADALSCLHNAGWRHGDLQSAHILVPPGTAPARLIDFALAQGPGHITPDVTYRGGLAHLTAPETAREILTTPADHSVRLTPAAEVYTFGAVLFAAWTKQWPHDYDGADPQKLTVAQIHSAICDPGTQRPTPATWPAMGMLIEAMLAPDAVNRPTMAQVRSMLAQSSGVSR